MKLLIAATLTAMAAGYATAGPNAYSADCYFYPGCHIGEMSNSAGGSAGTTSASGGPQSRVQQDTSMQTNIEASGRYDQAPASSSPPLKAQQNPYWEGCYFYPGC